MSKNVCGERLINGIVKENPTFVMMLGMCPTLAVTSSAMNGLGMGLSTTVVLILSNMLGSAAWNLRQAHEHHFQQLFGGGSGEGLSGQEPEISFRQSQRTGGQFRAGGGLRQPHRKRPGRCWSAAGLRFPAEEDFGDPGLPLLRFLCSHRPGCGSELFV